MGIKKGEEEEEEEGKEIQRVYKCIYIYIYIPRGPFAVVPLRLKRQELRLSGFSLFLQNEKIRKGTRGGGREEEGLSSLYLFV